jgi:topoisomerase-4 subunit B
LYCIDSGKNKIYCWTEEELKENVKKLGKVKVVRFKGLGEMDAEQLADTTMNTMNRRLIKLNGDDQAECERMVSILMGSNVQFRKDHIASQVNSVIKRN